LKFIAQRLGDDHSTRFVQSELAGH
jgi:hypothetical protein